MTVTVTPIDINTNNWGDVFSRLNTIADVISNNSVTVGGDPAVGDAVIHGSITVNTANISSITANTGVIVNLQSNTANISSITANSGVYENISANNFIAENFSANNIESITSNNINSNNLTVSNLEFSSANGNNLTSNNISVTNKLAVRSTELRYLATFGQPSANTTTIFDDKLVGVTANNTAGYKFEDTNNNLVAMFSTFGDGITRIINQTSHPLILGTANNEHIRLTANGFIGVGITSPNLKFHINGKVAVGDSSSNTRLTSDLSEAAEFSVIGAQGGIRIWKTSATGNVLQEYALGTSTAITSAIRWATGIDANGYFISSYNGSTPTKRVFVSNTGDLGIGTTANPVASAIVEISSTTKGLLPPRMTTTQRNNISSPANGIVIYNTTTSALEFYGNGWKSTYFSGAYSDLSGTPVLGGAAYLNVGTSANTVAAGNDSRITDAVSKSGDSLGGGYVQTSSKNLGNLAGSLTLTPSGGNIQHGTNNGATTISAPTASGVYTIIVEIVNNASAGAVTLTGFSKTPDGDNFTTTNGHKFLLHIAKTNSIVKCTVEAMQ